MPWTAPQFPPEPAHRTDPVVTVTDHPTSSRHLVDREVSAVLDVFPPFNLAPDTLDAVRDRLSRPVEGAPDPAQYFPRVVRTEYRIPGAGSDPEVRVIHYRLQDAPAPAPGLVWMHGGGYVMGSADDDDFLCRRLVIETGVVLASVDYRLAPETPAPGPVHDCYAALSWLHDNADQLGADANRLMVGGASAGGGLAASLAILARDRGELPVDFQALIYPMLDDRTASTRTPHPYAGEFIWTPSDNRFGWASLLGKEPGGADVSPYAAPARVESVDGLPATYLCVGALDLFMEEDLEFGGRLLRAGIPTELHVFPGGYHGYNMVADARITKAHFQNFIGALKHHVGS
jgi:triacylglycerol lipase